jgi:uroporphyrinogen decarboxylase
MNSKERVESAFRLDTPDKVPASPFGLGVWTMARFHKNFREIIDKPREYAEIILGGYSTLNQDMVFVGSGCNNFIPGALGGEMVIKKVGAPTVKEPIVKSTEEIDDLDVDMLYEDAMINTIRDTLEIVLDGIGDRAMVGVTSWTPISISGQLLGNEKFLISIYKNPALVKKLLDFSSRLCMAYYDYMFEKDLEFVALADGLASGDVVSRQTFKTLFAPALKKVIKYFRNKGRYVFLHICGNMTDRLDLIKDIKPHCYSMDYKVDLSYAKSIFQGYITYAGNINPVDIMDMGTPKNVEKASLKCLSVGAKDGGYVLMPGCDLPHSTPIENIRKMIETARNYSA